MNQEEREAKDVWYVVRNASWYMKSVRCKPTGEGTGGLMLDDVKLKRASG